MTLLSEKEQIFSMDITKLLIQYGENWIQLTNELFERDGFIIDIKRLYKFTSNVKDRIKHNISKLLKNVSTQKVIKDNRKLFSSFLSDLYTLLDAQIDKIKAAVNFNTELIECWDVYKTVYFEIGLEATSNLSKSSLHEIERLNNEFHHLKHKITSEIENMKNLLLRESSRPFARRISLRSFVSLTFFVLIIYWI